MAPNTPDRRRFILERGSVIVIHPEGPAGGYPRHVAVDRVQDGVHWFLGSCAPLGRGEQVMVEYPVPQDARYVTYARIEACSERLFALQIDDLWERAQQREFVRISTHNLLVRIVPAHAAEETAAGQEAIADAPELSLGADRETGSADIYPLLDISAGGIRFESDAPYAADEPVVCHFELPGIACFVLPARIVRTLDDHPRHGPKFEVAVEFVGLLEEQRGELLRWVYREQVKRHHDALRKAKQNPS